MKPLALFLLALVTTTAWAQQPSFLAVCVSVPSGLSSQTLPVIASTDLAAAQRVWGTVPQPGLVSATETVDGHERAVPAQLNVIGGKRVQIALLLSSEPAGERTIRVQPKAIASEPGLAPLRVTHQGAAVTVTNVTYAITHDPAENGGLPSKIVFPQTGKVFDTFALNDRLYSKELGGFRLGDDKSPQITVTAAGPLYAEVQVRARYLQGEKTPPGKARAVYTFGYFAGLPVVRLAADISQDESFSWDQLHIWESNFKDDSFTHFATSNQALTAFKDDKQSHRGQDWGALVDGKNAIGLLGTAMIYDGKNDYGRYLHGPWVQWSTPTAHFTVDLWIGATDDPVAAVAAAAASRLPGLTGIVYSPKLLEEVTTLQSRGKSQARLGWELSLLQSALRQQAISLTEAEQAAATMLSQPPAARDTVRLGGRVLHLVAGQRLGMAVGEGDNRIVSLYDLRYGRELLAAPALWFQLQLGDAAGATRILDSTNFSLAQPAGQLSAQAWRSQKLALQFASREADFPGLTVTIKPTLGDDRLSYSVAVSHLPARWSLLNVTAPVLQVATLGNNAANDHLLLPNGFGRSYPVLSGPNCNVRYPSGSACMQFMAVTDNVSGLYLGCHDPTASTKQLIASQSTGGAGLALSFEVIAPNATVPGNDFTVPGQFVIAAVDGGYFPACQLYRQWVSRNAPWWPDPGEYSRSDYPQWLQNTQTWVEWGAGYADKTVPPTEAFAKAMGVPTAIHWYNWHQIPFDNSYPHYFPTKPGFREGVKQLQQAGVRVMPYINGRLWDSDTPDFKTEGIKYATKDQKGNYYVEIYGSKRKLVPMCPSQPFWRNKLTQIVLRLVSQEGVDGVYMDQIGAAAPRLCYDKSHGHPLAGGHWWVDGYWTLLGALRKKIRQVSPDKILTTEANAEPYAKYFDAYLMCNSNGDYEVPLFPAVYGGKILMFGAYMATSDWRDLSLMALRQGKLFAFGAQLWWSNPNVVQNKQATEWLRDLAHLRQRVNDFFVHGHMAPPPVLAGKIGMMTTPWRNGQIHTPDLWATTWRLEDGRLLMPLVNVLKQQRTLTLDFDPARYGLKPKAKVKIERMTPAGVAETITRQGQFTLPVTLGPTEATALLITSQ